ncbi:GTP-binding protein [Halodesulfurarchaeum formicicum]|uniref:GTP-binding protein n=2 Tax=Halodesulfurarchaeum formicicum TaxID=1873524 RepID=A0A1J1ADA0_9EURY|nr:GTP-binding protein [Halodesulfurarchaeum formicicum]
MPGGYPGYMIFEDLQTTPTASELLDTAFSRAARAGRAKHGVEAQQSMLQTASNVLSDNLEYVVRDWPDFETLDPFYYELADALVGVDELRQHLSEVSWAGRKTHELGREYIGRLPKGDADAAKKIRQQAFARMGSVMNEVAADLEAIGEARNTLSKLPDIDPEVPTIAVAGYPNVGKTAFVNSVTRAHNETAAYPFTTTGINVGHVERDHLTYQIVDTPGLLDRPENERNEIESQATSALAHVADLVLYFYDPSETCGYPLEDQQALQAEIEATVDAPMIVVCSKADLSEAIEADHYLTIPSETAGEAVGETPMEVLEAAIERLDVDIELPFER